jgi:hypothetical protein
MEVHAKGMMHFFNFEKAFGIVGQRHFESSFREMIHGRRPSRFPLLKQFLVTINLCYHHQT